MRSARRLAQDRVAVIDLALDIACQAGAAIAEFARRAGFDAGPAQHVEDRFARRDFVFAAAPREARAKRAILGQLRQLTNDRLYADPNGLAQLQAAATEQLKKFEFNLRKQVDGDKQPLSLSGSDEVPAGFRQAIEEYYRALAKKGSKQP